jgi:hypothetical protein
MHCSAVLTVLHETGGGGKKRFLSFLFKSGGTSHHKAPQLPPGCHSGERLAPGGYADTPPAPWTRYGPTGVLRTDMASCGRCSIDPSSQEMATMPPDTAMIEPVRWPSVTLTPTRTTTAFVALAFFGMIPFIRTFHCSCSFPERHRMSHKPQQLRSNFHLPGCQAR